MIQPTDDRILVRRIEKPSNLLLTDKPKSIKGVVLAVGPGKWHPGEWWWQAYEPVGDYVTCNGEWIWYPGYRETVTVKPGQIIAFNSRWNDLTHAENAGAGADGKGKLERPLSYKLDANIHLIREADIFGILANEHVKVEYLGTAVEKEHFVSRAVAGPWSTP